MKMTVLCEAANGYERKWGMTFDEFAHQCRDGKLKENVYSAERFSILRKLGNFFGSAHILRYQTGFRRIFIIPVDNLTTVFN